MLVNSFISLLFFCIGYNKIQPQMDAFRTYTLIRQQARAHAYTKLNAARYRNTEKKKLLA